MPPSGLPFVGSRLPGTGRKAVRATSLASNVSQVVLGSVCSKPSSDLMALSVPPSTPASLSLSVGAASASSLVIGDNGSGVISPSVSVTAAAGVPGQGDFGAPAGCSGSYLPEFGVASVSASEFCARSADCLGEGGIDVLNNEILDLDPGVARSVEGVIGQGVGGGSAGTLGVWSPSVATGIVDSILVGKVSKPAVAAGQDVAGNSGIEELPSSSVAVICDAKVNEFLPVVVSDCVTAGGSVGCLEIGVSGPGTDREKVGCAPGAKADVDVDGVGSVRGSGVVVSSVGMLDAVSLLGSVNVIGGTVRQIDTQLTGRRVSGDALGVHQEVVPANLVVKDGGFSGGTKSYATGSVTVVWTRHT